MNDRITPGARIAFARWERERRERVRLLTLAERLRSLGRAVEDTDVREGRA